MHAQEEKLQSRTFTANQDTWVDQGAPSATHSDESELPARFSGSAGTRLLIGFDLSSLRDARVVQAMLSLNLVSGSGADPVDIAVSGVTQAWEDSRVDWTSQPPRTKTYAIQALGTEPQVVRWEITGLLTDMGSNSLHGVALSGPMQPPDYERRFAAVESEGGPTLAVSYMSAQTVAPDTGPPGATVVRAIVAGIALLALLLAGWRFFRRG